MKMFEVTTEYCDSDAQIHTEVQYVTASDNSLKTVTDYFTTFCFEHEKELRGVKEVVTVVQHITKPEQEIDE